MSSQLIEMCVRRNMQQFCEVCPTDSRLSPYHIIGSMIVSLPLSATHRFSLCLVVSLVWRSIDVLVVCVLVRLSVSVLLAALIIIFNLPYPSLRHRKHGAAIAPSRLSSGRIRSVQLF